MDEEGWEVFFDDPNDRPPNGWDCDACSAPITADGLLWIEHAEVDSFNKYCRACVMKGMRLLIHQQIREPWTDPKAKP